MSNFKDEVLKAFFTPDKLGKLAIGLVSLAFIAGVWATNTANQTAQNTESIRHTNMQVSSNAAANAVLTIEVQDLKTSVEANQAATKEGIEQIQNTQQTILEALLNQ